MSSLAAFLVAIENILDLNMICTWTGDSAASKGFTLTVS